MSQAMVDKFELKKRWCPATTEYIIYAYKLQTGSYVAWLGAEMRLEEAPPNEKEKNKCGTRERPILQRVRPKFRKYMVNLPVLLAAPS